MRTQFDKVSLQVQGQWSTGNCLSYSLSNSCGKGATCYAIISMMTGWITYIEYERTAKGTQQFHDSTARIAHVGLYHGIDYSGLGDSINVIR